MRNELFNKHYTQQAERACNNTVKDAYSIILDTAIAQLGEIDPQAKDKEQQVKQIKANAFRDVSRLSGELKTNMPKEICEEAVLKAVDEAIALYNAGEPIA